MESAGTAASVRVDSGDLLEGMSGQMDAGSHHQTVLSTEHNPKYQPEHESDALSNSRAVSDPLSGPHDGADGLSLSCAHHGQFLLSTQ